MAKKDPALRMKHYEAVRELTQAMAAKSDEAIQHLKAFGDDFAEVFEKTSKRHNALLGKISKRIERELKKSTAVLKGDSAKAVMPKVAKPKRVPAAKRSANAEPEAAS